MQFYGISFMLPYKQSGRWQDVLDTWYLYLLYLILSIKYIKYDGRICLILVLDVLDTEYQVHQARWQDVPDTWYLYLYLILIIKYIKYIKHDGRMCLILVLDILDTEYQVHQIRWQDVLDTWYLYLTYLILSIKYITYDGRMCLILDICTCTWYWVSSTSITSSTMAGYVWYLILILNVLDNEVSSTSFHRPDCLYGNLKEMP